MFPCSSADPDCSQVTRKEQSLAPVQKWIFSRISIKLIIPNFEGRFLWPGNQCLSVNWEAELQRLSRVLLDFNILCRNSGWTPQTQSMINKDRSGHRRWLKLKENSGLMGQPTARWMAINGSWLKAKPNPTDRLVKGNCCQTDHISQTSTVTNLMSSRAVDLSPREEKTSQFEETAMPWGKFVLFAGHI